MPPLVCRPAATALRFGSVVMVRLRNGVVIGFVAVLAVSCARYQPEPISPAVQAAALDSRTLKDARLQEFISVGLAIGGKRQATPSWDLNQLTLAAIYYHPDLDIARAKLASARAGVTTAAQVPNPILNASLTYNSTVVTPSPWTAGALVNFLLETFGRRPIRIAQAEDLADAARDDLATATWQVRGFVRTALLNLWAGERRLALTRRRLALQEQLVSLLEDRFKAGQESALNVTRERITRDQISLGERDVERQVAEARVQLAIAIGVPVSALNDARLSFGALERAVPLRATIATGDLRRMALIGRSDVRSLLAEYEAAQSALQLEVVKQFPNLNLGPGYTYDQGNNKYDLQLSADLPIFNQNQGPIAEAAARRVSAAARFRALQAQIIGAIDTAAASYRATRRALATSDSLLSSGKTRQQQVQQSFAAGQVDRSAVVTADLEVAAIELSRFDAIVQQRQAIGALEDALQHPLFGSPIRLPVPEDGPRLRKASDE